MAMGTQDGKHTHAPSQSDEPTHQRHTHRPAFSTDSATTIRFLLKRFWSFPFWHCHHLPFHPHHCRRRLDSSERSANLRERPYQCIRRHLRRCRFLCCRTEHHCWYYHPRYSFSSFSYCHSAVVHRPQSVYPQSHCRKYPQTRLLFLMMMMMPTWILQRLASSQKKLFGTTTMMKTAESRLGRCRHWSH